MSHLFARFVGVKPKRTGFYSIDQFQTLFIKKPGHDSFSPYQDSFFFFYRFFTFRPIHLFTLAHAYKMKNPFSKPLNHLRTASVLADPLLSSCRSTSQFLPIHFRFHRLYGFFMDHENASFAFPRNEAI